MMIKQKVFENKLDYVLNKVNKNKNILRDKFPHITKEGVWETTRDGYWTGGFWIGLLWQAYILSGEEEYKESIYKWLRRLESRKNDENMLFDLGFMFYPSFVLGYKITNDEYLKGVALEAANTLSTFFHERSGFVYHEITLNDKRMGRTIIDVMMELPLLWWAYKVTDNWKYYNIAYKHSKRTIEEFIRNDYSTVHVIDFDFETGEIIRKRTIQGYNDSSCWSRGQAWAIYGFALAYKTSKDELFLKTAENLARYFIEKLPEDLVPYWDFDDPEKEVRDSSAAAIASSGLLDLSAISGKKEFRYAAENILNALCDNYLCEENKDGILKHGCFHKHENIGVDESLIWGDYYFVDALIKVNK